MKKIIIALSLFMSTTTVFSDNLSETPENRIKTHQVSVRYSNVTGQGIGYQLNFARHYALKLTGWVLYHEHILYDDKITYNKNEDKNYNIGFDAQRDFYKQYNYRIFGFLGSGFKKKVYKETTYNILAPNQMIISAGNVEQTLLTGGLGLGAEYYFPKFISLDFGISYKIEKELKVDVKATDPNTKEEITVNEKNVNFGSWGLGGGISFNF